MKIVKVVLVLVIMGILGVFLVYKFIYNKPHIDYEKAEAEISVPASKLFEDFRNNPEDATGTYTGKVIEIAGMINNVETIDSLVVAVFVFDEGMFGNEGVRVTMLPAYHEAILGHNPNLSVILKGYCTGYNDTDVILEKGSIVH